MRVILYHPKTHHERFYRFYWIPYSILAVASGCTYDRLNVILIDANTTSQSAIVSYIQEYHDDTVCVGISCMTGHQIAEGLAFAKSVHEINPLIPIVWGGAHPTLFPKQCLDSLFVDFVVRGQGEMPFRELVQSLLSNASRPLSIRGVAEKHNNQYFLGPPRVLHNKNLLPPLPWHLLNLDAYVRHDSAIGSRVLNYVSSQGCPFGCGFCSEVALYKQNWSALSAERVVNDILTLVEIAGINGIKFYDANFFVSTRRAIEFAEMIKKYDIKWAASAHPSTLMRLRDKDWKLLSESGCTRILIGLESGSQSILDLIGKQFNVEYSMPLAKRLHSAGIIGSFTFVVGFPNSPDIDDVYKTLELGANIRSVWSSHEVKVHFYAPYPGTPLWPQAISAGFKPPITLEEWSEYDYYQIETPWVDTNFEAIVQDFNRMNCPYVQL